MTGQNADMLSITPSSGNVFADLGLPNAQEYMAKAKLAHQINSAIAEKELKKVAIASLLNISESSVTALSCGRLDQFSAETLTYFLRKLTRRARRISPYHSIAAAPRYKVAMA